PSIGPGLGGGGGNWRANLAPTPEILARVAALPPVRDVPDVDLDRESRAERRFSLPRLLAQFRAPLLVGLLLVILDALASLAGPVLVKTGVDNGVRAGSQGVLFAASAVYLLVTFADLLDQIGETFVTGRAAQRIMLSLRIRIWAQLQRLSLDYYESEMAGRIMTRMTTDVDQFESLIENGLLSALVSLVTFVGVGVALVVLNPELGLCTLGVVVHLIAGGHLTAGALIAFVLYIDLFFSPIQQLSQVFDSWQQTRVSVARIAELMTLESRTPPSADPVTPGRLRGDLMLEAVHLSYPTG